VASRDDFSFGRFWDLPVSESNMATTPKAALAAFHSVPRGGLLRICGSLFCGAGFGTKRGQEFSGGQGIDDIVFFQPAATRHSYNVMDEGKVSRAV